MKFFCQPFILATQPSCGADGKIELKVTGGTAPYQYSFDNGVTWQASSSRENLCGGSYGSFKVKDANGCEAVAVTVTLQEVSEIQMVEPDLPVAVVSARLATTNDDEVTFTYEGRKYNLKVPPHEKVVGSNNIIINNITFMPLIIACEGTFAGFYSKNCPNSPCTPSLPSDYGTYGCGNNNTPLKFNGTVLCKECWLDGVEDLSDTNPIGPIFNKDTGLFLGTSKEGFTGKLYFIEPSKLIELENKYGIFDPKLGIKVVPSLVLKKYGGGTYSTEMANKIECPNPDRNLANVLAEALNYIVSKTPMNNFPDAPSDFMGMLRNGKISTYFCTNPSCNCINTNSGSATRPEVIAEENTERQTITFNITYMKTSSYLVSAENIQCVFIHEFIGHRIRGIGAYKGHFQAYDIQKQYINYEKTTSDFKIHVDERRKYYFETHK